MATNYLKFQKRKLQEQLSQSPYSNLQREISQVGRETRKIARDTDATLKRQSVPLGARIEGQRQLQTNYAQNIDSAYDRVSSQDQQRKQDLMLRLDEVNMRLEEAEAQKKDGILNTAIQVGGTVLGAGVGLALGNPLLGAQVGAAAGQLISGVQGATSGDADEQDFARIGTGIVSGLGVYGEQSALNSVKAENTEAQAYLGNLVNSGQFDDGQQVQIARYIQQGMAGGQSLAEIKPFIEQLFPMQEVESIYPANGLNSPTPRIFDPRLQ